jgi:hypothetical protein
MKKMFLFGAVASLFTVLAYSQKEFTSEEDGATCESNTCLSYSDSKCCTKPNGVFYYGKK